VSYVQRDDVKASSGRFEWTAPWHGNVTIKGEHLHIAAALDQVEYRPTRTPLFLALWPGWAVFWDGPTNLTWRRHRPGMG